jgi:prevent-host-death family protein
MKVNVLEAKNRLSELIRSAQGGEEVVIANRGRPVARLVALDAGGKAEAERGSAQTILGWLAANPVPKHARRSPKEIEARVRAERRAWD